MKKNKSLIIILLIVVLGVVGLTIAYFSNTTSIDNFFSTKEYGTTIEEVFVSPDNWLPSDTTEKQITVTNSGQVDEAVRISYSEVWKAQDGTVLSGLIDENGNLTDEEANSEHAAIINFSNNDDWTESNEYYYYNYKLSPNETTSSLIDSVTFNSKVKNSSNCTTVENNGVKTITCNSTNSGYDGATYTLTFKIETVQFNKYISAWNTDVVVAEEKPLSPTCSYKIGDEITYDGQSYYVLQDSDSSSDYVVALKKEVLTAEEVNQYSTNYVGQDGEYPYYQSDSCFYDELLDDGDFSGCTNDYNQSNIKKIIDEWSSSYSNDLVNVNGYNARLILKDEVIDNLKYILYNPSISSSIYTFSEDTPDWSYINNIKYWSMTSVEDYRRVISVSDRLFNYLVSDTLYIRPVINLTKNVIESECPVSAIHGNTYNIGEKVVYNGETYYVIQNSDDIKDYVTLLKNKPLTYNEVITYKGNLGTVFFQNSNGIGLVNYYKSDACTADNNDSDCTTNYNDSFVKIIVDNWSNSIDSNLVEVNGYKARLLNLDELRDNFGYEYVPKDSWSVYESSAETPNWIKNLRYSSWTMTQYFDGTYMYVSEDNYLGGNRGFVANYNAVRPVINLKKCALTNTCE